MHNLHYIVVEAESGEDACEKAEKQLMDYGNENNWHSIGGAISQDNEIYVSDTSARWVPQENETIETLSAEMVEHFEVDLTPDIKETLQEIIKGKKRFDQGMKLYSAKQYLAKLYDLAYVNLENFNILYDSYKAHEFDEHGVTIIHEQERPKTNAENYVEESQNTEYENKLWVVYVDMHS